MSSQTRLRIYVGGSAFDADFNDLQPWYPVLNSAKSLSIVRNGREPVQVKLTGLQRWIAFKRIINGSPVYALGHQETVGGISDRAGVIIGGSNRKTIAWLHPSGRVFIGESYGSDD